MKKYTYREWGLYLKGNAIHSHYKTMKDAVLALRALDREDAYVKNEHFGFTILPSQIERMFTGNETKPLDIGGE